MPNQRFLHRGVYSFTQFRTGSERSQRAPRNDEIRIVAFTKMTFKNVKQRTANIELKNTIRESQTPIYALMISIIFIRLETLSRSAFGF